MGLVNRREKRIEDETGEEGGKKRYRAISGSGIEETRQIKRMRMHDIQKEEENEYQYGKQCLYQQQHL